MQHLMHDFVHVRVQDVSHVCIWCMHGVSTLAELAGLGQVGLGSRQLSIPAGMQ